MNLKMSAFIVSIVLSFSAVSASAEIHTWAGFCCGDGPDGTCGIGQSGAKDFAKEAAQAWQIYNGWPYADKIRIGGDQTGCSYQCTCPVSMLRHWKFEYHHLTTSDPWVEFNQTITWGNCVLAP